MKGAGITDPKKLIAGRTITVTNGGGSVSKTKQCLKSEPANNSSSEKTNSSPVPASPNPQKPDKEPDDEDKDKSGSVFQKPKAYEEYEWYENAADTTQKASRVKNKIRPHPNAKCDHVVYKTDPTTGKITNYKVYKVNSKNPTGFDEIVGYDGVGKAHRNKATKEALLPHVHDGNTPGQLRKPNIDEIP